MEDLTKNAMSVVVAASFTNPPEKLKLLSYMGYLELDYSKIENEVMTALDLDKNGKVDTDDIQELWNRTMKASDSAQEL